MFLPVLIVFDILSFALPDNVTYKSRPDCPTTVLDATIITKSVEVKSIIACARECQRDKICLAFNFLEPNICQMSSSELDNTCSNGYNNVHEKYYQRANNSDNDQTMTTTTVPTTCLHGGSLVNSTCQCVNGYIGSKCERLMEDCTEGYPYYQSQFGTFDIQPSLSPSPIKTCCWMDYDLRTYYQLRHYTTGISFNRNWTSYSNGFGDIQNMDFWWGNQYAYYLTNSRQYNLVLQVSGEDNNDIGNIVYENFVVQNEASNYTMTYSSVYIIPVKDMITLAMNDSMESSNGSSFSTYDQDNDNSAGNCASTHGAGWWFNNCTDCNPNGQLWPGGNSTRVGVENEFFWNNGLSGWSAWATALWFTRST
ncbi:fibrinogen-like protein 1 [Ylistrum balloti]|uniref:fibrinogen-like protein 1 n=1 Tax=Ylistrum balloti TaxID=509963 RepID=UPI0029057E73|nr:fibrinogen-like protein 1 [Ylistrum balloti]